MVGGSCWGCCIWLLCNCCSSSGVGEVVAAVQGVGVGVAEDVLALGEGGL